MVKANLRTDLQRIIVNCKDSAETYISAADNIKSEDLQNTFLLFALQRKNFVEILRREAWKSGYNLTFGSSIRKTLLKHLKSLMSGFSSNNDSKIIESCRECEEDLVDLYDEVLTNRDLPVNIYRLLTGHQQVVRSVMNQHLLVAVGA